MTEPFGITPKLPPNPVADLKDPEISWIIFINPPFATSNKTGSVLAALIRMIGKISLFPFLKMLS